MSNPLLRWLVLTLAVFLAASIIPGIGFESWGALFIASLVLGILNTVLKPILTLLSLPFIIFTLGLFLVVVNAATLGLTGWLVPGFSVHGFWSAIGGSLIISLVNLFFGGTKSKTTVQRKGAVHVRQNPNASSSRKINDDDVIDI